MEDVGRAVWRDLLRSRTATEEAHVTHEERVQKKKKKTLRWEGAGHQATPSSRNQESR